MRLSLRNNALLFVSFVVYLLTMAVVALTIDLQYYKGAKSELLKKQSMTHRLDEDNVMSNRARDLLCERNDKRIEQIRKDILASMTTVMDESVKAGRPIIHIDISDGKGIVRVERDIESRKGFNTFANSLLDRGFVLTIRNFVALVNEGPVIGFVNYQINTPVGDPEVESLTREYWLILFGGLLFVTAVYAIGLLKLILPIKKVTEAIQESQGKVTQFIARPHSRLERLYNMLARDALLTAVSIGLQNPKSRHLRMTLNELIEFLIPRITDWFGFSRAWIFDLVWEGPERLTPVRQLPPEKAEESPAWDRISEAFEGALVRNLHGSWSSKMPQVFHRSLKEGRSHVFLGILPGSETEGQMRVLAILAEKSLDGGQLAWYESTADRVYRQIIGLLERQSVQTRELFREKSEANINLSRNLGHDLTNIIATNKLELMTVGQLLRGDPATWFDSPQKAEVIKDSLTRLLDNTRSLQQIVNLYRAYEYLKSPRYESADIRDLFQEVIGIFRLSMSAAVEITCDFAPDLPQVEVEPRLLKLALFNMLSNAQDAVRRLPAEEQDSGRIVVQATLDSERDRVLVRLSDTGPGIRTPEGRLANEEEIDRIFDLGYSTKSAGEGLGLNWVRTILTEFHSGHLTAYNRPEGGATFEFALEIARPAEEERSFEAGAAAGRAAQ
ncbi:HAMP domain-containing histidine kinase [Candidatus Sumerlaeota bacterium]|nr:HAMP domain-containing histidine kinase [Candidatus Sumerlaeota bacterium]